jgi:endonuclease YncB( thermonuclease family)
MLTPLPPEPPAFIGRASVIDGDTIEIHGQRIRLWGIDAPESRQICQRGGEAYRCGQEAANGLAAMLGERPVRCQPVGRPDRYRRVVARCAQMVSDSHGTVVADVNAWMVRRGYAVEFPRYSDGRYAEAQAEARQEGEGMWAGEFQMPWEWRGR